ncbi:MAG: FecR family protein [Spirochaetia bacterium]|nr:FecR family protein [Spirochaetia bacterium]
MSLEESMTELEEFEFLTALKLSDEISADQESRLQELLRNPDFRNSYERYWQTHSFITGGLRSGPEPKQEAAHNSKPIRVTRLSANQLFAIGGVAAALIIGVSFLFYIRAKPTEHFKWQEVRGSCIQTGKPNGFQTRQGVCDLRSDTIALRLLPDSETSTTLTDDDLRIEFSGRLSVDAGKQRRPLVFTSGPHSIQILGTQLVLTAERGIFRAEMIEGSAELRSNGKTAVVSTGRIIEISNAVFKESRLTLDRDWLLRRWSSGMKGNQNTEIIEQLVRVQEPGIFYVLRLKDGRTFTGPVKQSSTHYLVMTTNGDFEVPNDQVESIDVYP